MQLKIMFHTTNTDIYMFSLSNYVWNNLGGGNLSNSKKDIYIRLYKN